MYCCDLNDDQIEELFVSVDRHRMWLERLYARIHERQFPPRDALRLRVKNALTHHRELPLFLNDSRRKGRASPYLKRARHWPRL